MGVIDDHSEEFQRFPEDQQRLVLDELAAGNEVLELGHYFPAPYCGAFIRLALPIRSRVRVSFDHVIFFERNTSQYSGEFSDPNRHFFVLEPPLPPPPYPDMDQIRADMEARYALAQSLPKVESIAPNASVESATQSSMKDSSANRPSVSTDNLVARFARSMQMDFDEWREGTGYDLDLLPQASSEELKTIEGMIVRQSPYTWRDVEALAALGTERSKQALNEAFASSDVQTRMAVHRYAPNIISEAGKTSSLVAALRSAEIYTGLSEALDEVEDFHPPEVIDALLKGLAQRDGATACHFAAMLYLLHGISSSAFDWEYRPFFLRFNTDDSGEREKAIRELCEKIGVDHRRCVT